MGITGGADAVLAEIGGKVSDGPQKGVYHVKVNDAVVKKTNNQDEPRLNLSLDLYGFEDEEHPAKEGKHLTFLRQTMPNPNFDDADKVATMKGMMKRTIFDGFNKKWPEKGIQDVENYFRDWIDLDTYVLIDAREDKRSPGTFRNEVVAVSTDPKKLPKLRTGDGSESNGKKETNGAPARRTARR